MSSDEIKEYIKRLKFGVWETIIDSAKTTIKENIIFFGDVIRYRSKGTQYRTKAEAWNKLAKYTSPKYFAKAIILFFFVSCSSKYGIDNKKNPTANDCRIEPKFNCP